MSEPALDVIVPVHDARRPVARLAASALNGTSTALRLTFVCHGIPQQTIRAALEMWADDPRVRLLSFEDGVRSPAGPFIAGLDRATAPFVMKIDSDDTLEPGAIDAWMDLRARTRADVVICRMREAGRGREWATPPARPGRRRLDPVRDRLAYRTSTMGVIDRELMLAAPPVEGIPTGEDIESSLRLWFSGARIALAFAEPAYLVHDDGTDRATAPRPLADEFAWLHRLHGSGFVQSLTAVARASIGTKLIRVQLFGAATSRAGRLTGDDLRALSASAATLVELSGGAPRWLSRADRALLDAILTGEDPLAISTLIAARRRFGRPATLLPREIRWILHREAPVRMMLASALAARRRTRRQRADT
jgi:hypothetical protein